MSFTSDGRGIWATVARHVGDDLRIKIGLLDMVSGAVNGAGATIAATVGGVSMSVDYSTPGLFLCHLTDAQTTSLGAGTHTLTFRFTPSGGDTQTYVAGNVVLSASSTTTAGSKGYDMGVVQNGVFVAVQ